MAEKYRQGGYRLKINTLLDEKTGANESDPLLLVAVHGDEYVSQPFQYTLTVWRDQTLGHVVPEQMINTKAMFGVLISEYVGEAAKTTAQGTTVDYGTLNRKGYAYRCGIIGNFLYDGVVDDRFFQYKLVIVPQFQMLQYETCFRVFEDKTFIEIIDEFQKIFYPDLLINTNGLSQETFPKMDYCVQFGESSLNFLSRLMARFGVWYYLDHDPKTWTNTLFLGRLKSNMNFNDCKINDPQGTIKDIDVSRLVLRQTQLSLLSITSFTYEYKPLVRRYRVGNFNTLAPRHYFTGKSDIEESHDLFEPVGRYTKPQPRKPPSDSDRFRTESFPEPAASNQDATKDAEEDMWPREAQTIVAHGSTRNPAFLPGYEFHLVGDLPAGVTAYGVAAPDVLEDPKGKNSDNSPALQVKDFVITYNKIGATEHAYLSHPGVVGGITDFFSKFWNNLWGKNDPSDAMANFTNQGLNNYLQNQLPLNLGQGGGTTQDFGANFVGGGFAWVASVVPVLVTTMKDALKGPPHSYSNSFAAIPLDWTSKPRSLPLPTGYSTPSVAGPHLATVVGKEGTKRVQGNDIYADALGRVRVRFPWQWLGEPVDSRKWYSDDITCWVRVTQGWAGRHFGWQFIPRVGEEVIVDFIGGDPNRPIITGRVYNADNGTTNPPFLDETKIEKLTDLPPTVKTNLPYSGVKTSSMPTVSEEGSPLPARYHLLRFDDTRDKEQYLIRSQRRMDVTVMGTYYNTTHGSYNLSIGGQCKAPSLKCGGDFITKVFKNYHLHVGKNNDGAPPAGSMITEVAHNYDLTVGTHTAKGDFRLDLKQDWSAQIAGNVTVNATGPLSHIVINSNFDITLQAGESMIYLSPAGIFLQAPQISLLATAAILLNAPGIVSQVPVLPVSPGGVPFPPAVVPPLTLRLPDDPAPADPGNTLTPPKE